PLVAVASLGDIALRHDWTRLVLRHRLENRAEVAIPGRDQKHAFAAVSVQRLHDHLAALLVKKSLQARNFIGDERWRNGVGKIQRVELFVGLAKSRRMVEHKR